MHRVEEISLLRDQVETLEADRDRWRRYAGMLRDRLAAAQDAVRKWHHHAYCRDDYNGRVGEELRSLAAERDALNRQLDHADGRIIDLTSCVDALRQQLDESDHQLALRIEADNANRGQLAAAKDQVRMVVESWRQLKARYAESPANHAVPLALLLAHVSMLAGDWDTDAYLFLAALNRTMLDRAQCADLQEQLAECRADRDHWCQSAMGDAARAEEMQAAQAQGTRWEQIAQNLTSSLQNAMAEGDEAKAELRQWRGCPSCMEDHPEGTTCPPHETRVTGQAWRQRQTRQWAERARIAEQALCDLLAVIHRDGGQHTGSVGLVQSVADAHQVWGKLRVEVDEANAARERAEAAAANLYKQRIDAKLNAERLMAEAGVLRAALEEIAASTAGDDEPGDRSPRRAGWECVQRARAVLASGAGEKAAAVIAAATEFWRDRTQRIGPLDPSVVDRLLAAVAAMEGIGDG